MSIEKELKHLKRNKATSTDDLPTNLIKYSAVKILSALCLLINLSLKIAKVPTEFKHTLIATNHNRPISILPIISKLLEKSIHKKPMDHL